MQENSNDQDPDEWLQINTEGAAPAIGKDEVELLHERNAESGSIFMPTEEPISWMVQFLVAVAISSGMAFIGIGLAYSSPALLSLREDANRGFQMSTQKESWFGSCHFLGAFLGAFIGGPVSHKLGRKRALELCVCPLLLGGFLCLGVAKYLFVLLIGRALVGIACGITTTIIPMYLAEVAAASIRGSLGILTQIMLLSGVVIIFIFGTLLDYHWMGYASATLVAPFWVVIFLCPESPTWLVYTGQHGKARRSLSKIKGPKYDHESEVKYLDFHLNQNVAKEHKNWKNARNLVPLFASVILLSTHGLSGGIDTVTYLALIFQRLKIPINGSLIGVVFAIGQVFVLVVFALVVDRMPRKFYLIFSACLTIALLVATCVCFFFEKRILEMSGMNWVVASFVIGFLTATNLGVAPLGWVVSAELLPTTAKKVGLSVLHGARWSTGALVTYLFPIVSEIAGMQYVFLWHTLYMVFYLAFVAFFVPETKGKTEPEIQQLIQQQVPWLISPQPLPPRNDPAPTVEEDSTNE